MKDDPWAAKYGETVTKDPAAFPADRRIKIVITQAKKAFSHNHDTTIKVCLGAETEKFERPRHGILLSAEEVKPMIAHIRQEFYKITRRDILAELVDPPENESTEKLIPPGGYPWQNKENL